MAGQRTYREKRPVREGSPAALHPAEFAKDREYVDVLRWHHVGLSSRFLAASDGDLYGIDLGRSVDRQAWKVPGASRVSPWKQQPSLAPYPRGNDE